MCANGKGDGGEGIEFSLRNRGNKGLPLCSAILVGGRGGRALGFSSYGNRELKVKL